MQISTLKQKRILSKPKAEKNCLYFKSFKKLFKNMKGQSTVEYAVLIACVMLALMTMYGYIKRGIQGKMRESADQIGSQYEPGNTVSDFTISSRSDITTISSLTLDDNDNTNATTVTTTNYDTQQRVGTETVGAL